jgi:hypothetical protein
MLRAALLSRAMVRTKVSGGGARLQRAAIAITAVFTVAIQIAAAAPIERDAQSIASSAIRRLDLQTEVTREPEPFRIRLPPEILWLVIAIALGTVLYSLRDLIPLFRSSRSDSWADESMTAEIERRDPALVLAAADELAGEGRYAEAMHVLLLRGLADIRARLDEPFADSLTSREILRSTRLPDKARDSLRDVVGRVEWTYFGEYPAGQQDYAACRTSFSALEQALHGSAAA